MAGRVAWQYGQVSVHQRYRVTEPPVSRGLFSSVFSQRANCNAGIGWPTKSCPPREAGRVSIGFAFALLTGRVDGPSPRAINAAKPAAKTAIMPHNEHLIDL